jgi:hypothetical protein
MAYHNSTYFSTRNYDHDTHIYSCAVMFDAPWWFGACHSSLLTGEYGRNLSYARGITWSKSWGYYKFARYATMMIRPNK